jgi:hypothetical protein
VLTDPAVLAKLHDAVVRLAEFRQDSAAA